MMKFSAISPTTYRIAVKGHILKRKVQNLFEKEALAREKDPLDLEYLVYTHKSLIMRRLGNTDIHLQENKKVNLGIAAPKVNHILIKPGETFSFWELVGSQKQKYGYLEGVVIAGNKISQDIGGGMCQFTNLLHWMILHSPLTITEYHSHDRFDLFPDFKRQVPFGIGTSIFYNYLDYRFKNETDQIFQLNTWCDDTYLCGELRTDVLLDVKYHIRCEDEFFERVENDVYRRNKIYRVCNDKLTGRELSRELLKTNRACVMYDHALINGKIV